MPLNYLLNKIQSIIDFVTLSYDRVTNIRRFALVYETLRIPKNWNYTLHLVWQLHVNLNISCSTILYNHNLALWVKLTFRYRVIPRLSLIIITTRYNSIAILQVYWIKYGVLSNSCMAREIIWHCKAQQSLLVTHLYWIKDLLASYFLFLFYTQPLPLIPLLSARWKYYLQP